MSVTREVSPGIFDTPRIVCCYKFYMNVSRYWYEQQEVVAWHGSSVQGINPYPANVENRVSS
jgi:hypothetical protein